MGDQTDEASRLCFAIAHEVGNHLGAIRLQAHLLDDEAGARALAEASVLIDELAGRSGPLLALLRPLLSEDWQRGGARTWSGRLGQLQRHFEEAGTRGTAFEVAPVDDRALAAPDWDWVHPALVALVDATLHHAGRGGRVRLAVESAGRETRFVLEDDGPEEDLSPAETTRGRPLAVGLLRELAGRIGGRVEGVREGDRTRVTLTLVRDD